MWRLILVLVLLLNGCSGVEPNREIVENAIALQTRLLQQQLQQQINKVEISQVNVTQTTTLIIDRLTGYRINGTYDLKLPKQRLSQQKNPFDIYLQRQKEGKTWRLALPKMAKNGVFTWLTYAIN
ncbi:hypothetical protein [Chlorogloea sp. CCALA 695]|uniref:hypothetical protein n=1 Tax=Chlorogloea sp. CCALA 695 TaxID=2107693 RepID=UPI000D07519C|nr:hypothetical protein [Chlorogloea sp. CCALA 695]PSB29981.1 hypothetical protein C7B70_17240 [Chlorogloea sp. CCALA 695]